jgi:hypothetical protein
MNREELAALRDAPEATRVKGPDGRTLAEKRVGLSFEFRLGAETGPTGLG